MLDIHPQIITRVNGYVVSTVCHTGCMETMVFTANGWDDGDDMSEKWVDFHNGTKSDMKRSNRDGVEWAKSQGKFRKSDIHTPKKLDDVTKITISVADFKRAIGFATDMARHPWGYDRERIANDTLNRFNIKG